MFGDEVLCKYFPVGEVKNFIAWMNVEGVGINHGAWRNWANSLLVLFI